MSKVKMVKLVNKGLILAGIISVIGLFLTEINSF